ncbi:zinc finger protein 511 [Neocloeon triangulifer]|uniref:zinc finger protein 511 n=1 Tax=Neocloeon triangulifer TaxID=2078957 RepID=UPI00286EF2AC|nr:zinc finger protein 511 [Neocloeon triangulifer]
MDEILVQVNQIIPGRRSASDPNFAAGDAICGPYKVLGIIDIDIENESVEFACEVHGCSEKLSSVLDLEQHYNTVHRFECHQCHKHLASAHLLDLHICESHDTFFELQSSKTPMFSCFVIECPLKSWNAKERMAHCVEMHNFPANFRYDVVPRKSNLNSCSMEVDSEPKKRPKKKKPCKPASENPTPQVLGGGGRRGRGRLASGWHQRATAPSIINTPTAIDMQDLEQALPPS